MTDRLSGVRTPWTDIVNAQLDPALRARCLELLAEKYYEPIRSFIVAAMGVNRPEAADDLTQAFFLRFIESDCLDVLDRERGRLRNWFKTSVRRFVLDEMKKGNRGNAASPFCKLERLPGGDIAPPDRAGPTPEEEFNRRWARELFADAVTAFRRYCRDNGKQRCFQVFERHVLAGGKAAAPSYGETAAELGMSVKDVSNCLGRTKKKFQALLRELVRATVAGDGDVDAELRDLLRHFR
ncbi:MAG: sigma-70 family RNA polymerase sigma factor [Planctomycetota bacterium]|jgi:RNA polymerase sigma factor (sigma-70 family)|nr:sigma-70 family RNA polymerase sigma factor [Planctomycetota bacterium]